MTKDNRLNGKDLINIGVFAAIYMVIMVCISILGFIPVFMVLLDVLVPLICNIILMLFFTRVKKFGMILIFTFLLGLLQILTGMGPYAIITSLVFGLLADLIAKSGAYKSEKKFILAATVQSGWVWGDFFPIFLRNGWFASSGSRSEGYQETIEKLCPGWMFPVMLLLAFLAGFIGAMIGRSLLKKQFRRAGIA